VPGTRTALGLLSLTMAIGGCSPATGSKSAAPDAKPDSQQSPADGMWVTSDDGLLALRLSAISRRVATSEDIQVAAEIRNNSQQTITVLRPFGDDYAARAVGMKIWDGQRWTRYTGPTQEYTVGSGAFAVLGPGEVVEDRLALTIDNYAGMGPPGTYTLRYDYSYNGQWDKAAAKVDSGTREIWRGAICSREVQVVRQQPGR
jgi:hypothetical protein